MTLLLWHTGNMGTRELLHRKREDILRLATASGAGNVRIFGSVVRGEDSLDSDIDFLVTMDHGTSLFDIARLMNDLEALLRRKVDIVEDKGLSPYIRERVLHEALPL